MPTLYRATALNCLLITLICSMCAMSSAQTPPSTPVSADNALGDTSWYDADTGKLIPMHVKEVTDDSMNRYSRWLPKAEPVPKQTASSAANTPTTTTGTGLFGSNITLGNLFGWLLLALIVCIIVGTLVYAFSKAEIDFGGDAKSKGSGGDDAAPDAQTIERMKHLPAELRRTDVNMRSEAERLMQEAQFDQAIILLFGHQLLLLDHAGLLRLSRGKTNGRYVRETRAVDRDCGDRLRLTATAFERSYFGRHSITGQEFAMLWHSNELLEQRITQRAEAAA